MLYHNHADTHWLAGGWCPVGAPMQSRATGTLPAQPTLAALGARPGQLVSTLWALLVAGGTLFPRRHSTYDGSLLWVFPLTLYIEPGRNIIQRLPPPRDRLTTRTGSTRTFIQGPRPPILFNIPRLEHIRQYLTHPHRVTDPGNPSSSPAYPRDVQARIPRLWVIPTGTPRRIFITRRTGGRAARIQPRGDLYSHAIPHDRLAT